MEFNEPYIAATGIPQKSLTALVPHTGYGASCAHRDAEQRRERSLVYGGLFGDTSEYNDCDCPGMADLHGLRSLVVDHKIGRIGIFFREDRSNPNPSTRYELVDSHTDPASAVELSECEADLLRRMVETQYAVRKARILQLKANNNGYVSECKVLSASEPYTPNFAKLYEKRYSDRVLLRPANGDGLGLLAAIERQTATA